MDHHGSVRRLWTIFSYSQRPEGVNNNVIFAYAGTVAVSGLASAFILPWFPNVCREQGLSRWETGLVFAAMDFTMLLCRWPMVELCKRRGIRQFYFVGFCIQAGACFGLGFVWAIKSTGFFTTCLLFRIAQGVGGAMCSAASLQVVNTLVFCNVSSISSCVEGGIGLARVLGAPFGALVFHSFGGGQIALKMAFWFLAAMFAGTAILSSGTIVLPVDPPAIREREPGEKTPWSEMFGSRLIAMSLVAIFFVDFVSGVLEPTLSIHLWENFEMGVYQRGLIFMQMGLFGLLAAPVTSLLGEYTSRKLVMTFGCFLSGMAILGMGVGKDKNVMGGFAAMLGIALCSIATPAIPAMLWDIPHDSQLTDGEVARVTNALGALAAVIGPVYGAGVAESLTFKGMTMMTGAFLWLFTAFQIILFATGMVQWRNASPEARLPDGSLASSDDSSQQPLLQKQTDVSQVGDQSSPAS